MCASIIPASTASASSSLSSPSVTVAAYPSFTDSAHNQPYGKKDKDECMCQAAYDFPTNARAHPHLKSFSTCNSPKVFTSGLDCVQCVESFPDSMNHCVPEWDAATGKEMDIIWEQTDLFSPSKGKWDFGHTRKSDLGSVPELDFEELCWEDGQLLVVMQGLHCRGTTKNQSTNETTLTSVSPTISTFNIPRFAELVDPSSVNMHTQEDELLSWLQHPPDDVGDRLEIPSDSLMLSTSLADRERVYASEPTPRGSRRNLGLSEDCGNGSAPKFTKPPNTLATYPSILGNKTVHESINQQTESATGPALVPSAPVRNKEQCEPCLPLTDEVEMPCPLQTHSASVSMPYGTSLPNASTRAMNFSNFSRPAVAIKANLKSLGIANGPSGAERLKQLDRVAADIYKAESVYSSRKHLKLIAPRRGVPFHAVPSLSQSVGASLIEDPGQKFPLQKETKQSVSASESSLVRRPEQGSCDQGLSITGASNRSPEMRVESNGLISTTILAMDASTEVLDVPQRSELSSGGSEISDFDGKKASDNLKRKFYHEDSKFQSEALEHKVRSNKQQAGANGNDLKRSKTTESHNQSERRRRDRISEKMKALLALVPNSHKIDKASMLEEAIAYIKALKFQIQMMSSRGGMHSPPMVLPLGVQQHVQMASWPIVNVGIGMHMGMGMGMNAGMGVHDMNMVMGIAAPRPFSPMMTFPSPLVPGAQTTAPAALMNTAHIRHGVAGHVVPLPAHHLMVPLRPAVPIYGDSDSTLVAKDASPQSCPTSQQGQPVQIAPMGAKVNNLPL